MSESHLNIKMHPYVKNDPRGPVEREPAILPATLEAKPLPLLTVITVVLNGAKHIEQTILSVVSQSYVNVEYIVIDGGSTDGTIDIIHKYSHSIQSFVSEFDNGIYDAMNKAIALATGEWVIFMNAGDLFCDNDVLSNIFQDLAGDMIYGNHAVYYGNRTSFKLVNVGSRKDIRNLPFCHQAVFTKTLVLQAHPFDLGYTIAADYDQYLKLKKLNANITHVPLTVALYLDGGISSTSRRKLIKEYYHIQAKYHPIPALLVYLARIMKLSVTGK
jgi:glycosyltransferase involved in cell wall biosynthesis